MPPSSSLPPNLETKITEFLQTMSPLKEVMSGIVDWHVKHDAQHEELSKTVNQELQSHHFRIRSLEANAGGGWWGVARTIALIIVAASGGFALRAATDAPAVMTGGLGNVR